MKNASKGGKKYPTARSLALCVFAGYIFFNNPNNHPSRGGTVSVYPFAGEEIHGVSQVF